jgi:hypothetical protein
MAKVGQFDPRLIGRWKSDRRMTFRNFRPKPRCSPASLRKLKGLFGKLVVRWGRTKVFTDLDGYRDSQPYEVVARDAMSVVVRTYDPLAREDRLLHIHFGDGYYWIAPAISGGRMCEFFRRVPEP